MNLWCNVHLTKLFYRSQPPGGGGGSATKIIYVRSAFEEVVGKFLLCCCRVACASVAKDLLEEIVCDRY